MVFSIHGSSDVLSGGPSGPLGVRVRSTSGWSPANVITDDNAEENHAITVANAATSSFVLSVLPGTFDLLVRYRFIGTTPSDANLHLDQSGRTTLAITAVTPADTYDGGETYFGRSGWYDLGQATLEEGTLTIEVDGPGSAGDSVVIDEIAFRAIPAIGVGAQVIGTSNVIG